MATILPPKRTPPSFLRSRAAGEIACNREHLGMNPINFALRRPKTVMLLLFAIVMTGISVVRLYWFSVSGGNG